MRFHITTILVTVVLSLTVIGCEGSKEQENDGNAKITVTTLPFLTFAPIHIAREEGFFEDQGLDVEYVHVKRAAHALPALENEKLDVCAGAVSIGLFNAIGKGLDVRIVADKGRIPTEPPPYIAFMVRDELPEEDIGKALSDLDPVRLAGHHDTFGLFLVNRMLSNFGIDLEDVHLQNIHSSSRIEAIGSGEVDCIHLSEPWVTRARRAGTSRVVGTGYELTPGAQWAVILFGPRLLRKEPELGRRFMMAYVRGIRQFNEGKTERNLDILERATGLERNLLEEAGWPMMRNDGSVNTESLRQFQEWSVSRGTLTRVIEPAGYRDLRFINYANEKLEELESGDAADE